MYENLSLKVRYQTKLQFESLSCKGWIPMNCQTDSVNAPRNVTLDEFQFLKNNVLPLDPCSVCMKVQS